MRPSVRSDRLFFGLVVVLGLVGCAEPLPSLTYDVAVRGQVGAPQRFTLPPGPTQISLSADEADLALVLKAPDGEERVVDRWATPTAGEHAYLRAADGATVEVQRAREASTQAGAFTLSITRADANAVDLDARIETALAQAKAPDAASRRAAWPALLELEAEARDSAAPKLAEIAAWTAARTAARVGAPAWQTILPSLTETATGAVQAEAHLELAARWADLGLPEPAREHLQAGLRAAPRDPRVQALAMMIEASLAAESSQLVEARALTRKARAAAEDARDPTLDARIAGVEGDVLVLLGDRAGASAAFEREFARAQDAGEPVLERQALHHLGVILSNFDEDWEGASRFFERAIALAKRVGDVDGLASDLDALGEMASTLKRPGAVDYHRQALALRRASGSRRGEAQTLISLGSALARLRRPQDALPHLREGAEKMRALGNRPWEAYAYFRLGRALFKLEDFAAAAEAARFAIDIVESLRAQVGTEDGRAELMDAVRWYFDLYVSAAGEAHRRSPDERWLKEILQASERARARTLLELITELDLPLDAELPAALRTEVQGTKEQIKALEGAQRLARARSAPAAEVQALEVKIEAKMAQYAKLRRRVEAADPRRAALVATPLVTLEQVRDLLGPEAVAVELYLGAGGAYALAIGTATSAVHALGPQGPIEASARALHGALSARNRRVEGEDAARRAARIREADRAAQEGLRKLKSMLLAPLSGVLAGAHKVVVVARRRAPLRAIFGRCCPITRS